MKTSRHTCILFANLILVSVLALTAVRLPAQTIPCFETNGVKFILPPQNFGGFDVKDSRDRIVLADDFFCNTTGPITDIHLWGSWIFDNHGTITNFWIGIYDDVPAVTNAAGGLVSWSHPGTNLLWQQSFGPGQFSESIYTNADEYFFNPTNNTIIGNDQFVWYYCFFPTNPFIQRGSANLPTNYWLAVRADLQQTNAQILYGWKSTYVPYNDPAVWGTVVGNLPNGIWQSITNPFNQQPLHLSMKLTTPTNQTPTGCVETNGTKYVQWPDLFGLDVWDSGPWVLADDFICTNAGPVTDIHLWGSWRFDQVLSNSLTFTLAIYDDVPVSPTNQFSHPGNLKWQQSFAPGQYIETFWSFGQESFLDPGVPAIIGPDQQVWYYCFYPTNPFVQSGSMTATQTYWLVARAQLPSGTDNFMFGWKTTTNVQHDISVYAPWPGGGMPPNPWPWNPTRRETGQPLDLAFKITTDTNRCPIPVTCAVDKVVECGIPWVFDPPIIGPDPCCPTAPSVTFSAITNHVGPCKDVITATWMIVDCLGTTATCTQNVTVVDSTPPVITCPTNKTVVCGSLWTFDTPTAVDACCGTNVNISILNTVTSGICPKLITRTWQAMDCCSNTAVCSQIVTNLDITPPSIACPSNIVVLTCDSNATMISWSIIAADTCGSVTVTSTPPSGSLFLPNTTNIVVATARDDCGNTNSCTFTVTVRRPVLGPIFITPIPTNLVVLTWTNGILQVCTNVLGPYVDVPSATSPYTNSAAIPPDMRFYRLRCNEP